VDLTPFARHGEKPHLSPKGFLRKRKGDGMETDKRRKTYDRQFKMNAVGLVLDGERKVWEVARELGIDANTLYHWKREFLEEQEAAFPGKGHLPPMPFSNLPCATRSCKWKK
jgi:transposase-like protein